MRASHAYFMVHDITSEHLKSASAFLLWRDILNVLVRTQTINKAFLRLQKNVSHFCFYLKNKHFNLIECKIYFCLLLNYFFVLDHNIFFWQLRYHPKWVCSYGSRDLIYTHACNRIARICDARYKILEDGQIPSSQIRDRFPKV